MKAASSVHVRLLMGLTFSAGGLTCYQRLRRRPQRTGWSAGLSLCSCSIAACRMFLLVFPCVFYLCSCQRFCQAKTGKTTIWRPASPEAQLHLKVTTAPQCLRDSEFFFQWERHRPRERSCWSCWFRSDAALINIKGSLGCL